MTHFVQGRRKKWLLSPNAMLTRTQSKMKFVSLFVCLFVLVLFYCVSFFVLFCFCLFVCWGVGLFVCLFICLFCFVLFCFVLFCFVLFFSFLIKYTCIFSKKWKISKIGKVLHVGNLTSYHSMGFSYAFENNITTPHLLTCDWNNRDARCAAIALGPYGPPLDHQRKDTRQNNFPHMKIKRNFSHNTWPSAIGGYELMWTNGTINFFILNTIH